MLRLSSNSSICSDVFVPVPRPRVGFTLIELMVVIGIIAVVLMMAVPNLYRYLHPNALQKGMDDVMAACHEAREAAVLSGTATALAIDLRTKTFSIRGASAQPSVDSPPPSEFAELNPRHVAAPVAVSGHSYQLSDRVVIEGLGINGLDYTTDEQAEVRFYPRGTSDELSIVLTDGPNQRNIILDSVTGYPDFEVDPTKFRHR
jgi:prepilin-type N-terminal cleavage/methylation domain-containing protein